MPASPECRPKAVVGLLASILLCVTLFGELTLSRLSVEGAEAARQGPRARDLGIRPGVLPTGKLNAITDVDGVQVGQVTLNEGANVRTGVTAIVPHVGNLFRDKVRGAIFRGNGFGKLIGSPQVNELGEIETPILLTNTLAVAAVADALIQWMLALPGNEDILSVNPVVGETNDGYLNDIRQARVGKAEVYAALRAARGGPVDEGAVGAGTGTVAFGFKAGIGTSSRMIPKSVGGYTVGALVQANFGGVLTIDGAPLGRELGTYFLRDEIESEKTSGTHEKPSAQEQRHEDHGDGSIMIVVATDAPLDSRNLERLAARAMLGLARTGSASTNGSGDFVIAFSTVRQNRTTVLSPAATGSAIQPEHSVRTVDILPNEAMSPLFLAVIEATEEAIYNALLCSSSMTGYQGHRVDALPKDRTVEILTKYGSIKKKD